jgi:Homeodomain-like domain-containing protein
VRSRAEYEQVVRLVAEGLNDCEIARLTAIPRRTVHDWRRSARRCGGRRRRAGCAVCLQAPERLPHEPYAYLLGAYLGDGHIVSCRRGVYRLRVYCDARHPDIAREVAQAICWVIQRPAALQPGTRSRMLIVSSYSKHWPCLLPQHGPGRKHERRIALTEWQQAIVDAQPEHFLRGLIHSDGSRFVNRIRHPRRTYEYIRYQFTNRSSDIRRLFCDTCDALGVEWRPLGDRDISIARRGSVAKLDTFIGPKS